MSYLYNTDSLCCSAPVIVNELSGTVVCSSCNAFDPKTKPQDSGSPTTDTVQSRDYLADALAVARDWTHLRPSKFAKFVNFVFDADDRIGWKVRYGNTPHPEGTDYSANVPTNLRILPLEFFRRAIRTGFPTCNDTCGTMGCGGHSVARVAGFSNAKMVYRTRDGLTNVVVNNNDGRGDRDYFLCMTEDEDLHSDEIERYPPR